MIYVFFMPLYFWVLEGLILLFMIRNQLVGRERQRVNREMHRLGQQDIDQGYLPFWRYEHFYAVSYFRMCFSVRRIRSFYRDSPALKPIGELDFEPPRLPGLTQYLASVSSPNSSASERAEELLDRHLTAQQRETVKQRYLQITGKSGRHYCIHWDAFGNGPEVFTMARFHRKYGHARVVCCRVGQFEGWPVADQVLALKLCLESSDEMRVINAAVQARTDFVTHPWIGEKRRTWWSVLRRQGA